MRHLEPTSGRCGRSVPNPLPLNDPNQSHPVTFPGRAPTTGDVVLGYRLGLPIGRGASATVYQAVRPDRPGEFAIKVIDLANLGNSFAARLEREVEITTRLRHPNLIAIHESAMFEACFVIAMDRAAGVAADRLTDGKLGWTTAVRIAHQVALALAYAWNQHHLVHRDVKPANILVDRSGDQLRRVVLVDFGLARDTGATTAGLTMTGTVMGTPFYLSPEQARGERNLDGRSDQYALAASLFHLIVGRPPFPGRTPIETILAHLNDPPPDVREFDGSVPPALSALINRGLEKQPAKRYPDHDAMATALQAVLDGGTDDPFPEVDEPTTADAPSRSGTGSIALAELMAERLRTPLPKPATPAGSSRWGGPPSARFTKPKPGSEPLAPPPVQTPRPPTERIPEPTTDRQRVDGQAPTRPAPALSRSGRHVDGRAPTAQAPAIPSALERDAHDARAPTAPMPKWPAQQPRPQTEEINWLAPAEDPVAPAGMFPALEASSDRRQAVGSIASGTLIDSNFRVDAVLGSGAGGEVYVVTDQLTGRELAMKVLGEREQSRAGAVKRFRAESAALATLDHPAFPYHAGYGAFRGRDYLLMERVAGKDLKSWLKANGAMNEALALKTIRQLAEAMAHAHTRCGMVHRDLKPANLMFVDGTDHQLKIIDLGLSTYIERSELDDFIGRDYRYLDDGSDGQPVGTPAYMAPEQAEGAPPTPSMDVYAIGATLYQLLSGRTPFTAPSVEAVLLKHRTADVPDLPPAVNASSGTRYLVRRCLAKHPKDRFRTWKQLIQAVDSGLYSTTRTFRRT